MDRDEGLLYSRTRRFGSRQDFESAGCRVGDVRRNLASGKRLDARLRSLDVLGAHPDPDVRRTVTKHDTPAFFKLPQQTNNSAIRED